MNRVLMICITLAFTTAAVFTAGPTLRARQDGPLPDYDDKEIIMCPHAEEVYYTGAGENVEDWPLDEGFPQISRQDYLSALWADCDPDSSRCIFCPDEDAPCCYAWTSAKNHVDHQSSYTPDPITADESAVVLAPPILALPTLPERPKCPLDSSAKGKGHRLSTGAKAGIIGGSTVGSVLLFCSLPCILLGRKKRRSSKSKKTKQDSRRNGQSQEEEEKITVVSSSERESAPARGRTTSPTTETTVTEIRSSQQTPPVPPPQSGIRGQGRHDGASDESTWWDAGEIA